MSSEISVPAPRSSFRWRLLLAFVGVSSFAILGGAVAIYAFSKIEDVLERITDHSVPSVLLSLQLSRDAERLVSAAPVLLTSINPGEHQEQASKIRNDIAQLSGVLDSLKQYQLDASVIDQIASAVDWLTLNLISMETTVGNALAIGEQRKAISQNALELASVIQLALEPKLEELNYEADAASTWKGIQEGQDVYTQPPKDIASLRSALNLRFELATLADRLAAIGLIDGREKLNSSSQQFSDSLDRIKALVQQVDPTLNDTIADHAALFYTYVEGSKSVLRIRLLEFEARQNAQRLLTESMNASQQLTQTIERLVRDTEEEIKWAGDAARQERRTGTTLLIVVVALSLLSSVLVV
ncbi:MAG: hypothetical protein P8Y12_12965, partial [Gammaproteobacteria bacterium]